MRGTELAPRAASLALLLAVACTGRDRLNQPQLEVWEPAAGDSSWIGGFSDLVLDPSDSTRRTFFTIEDRGPNRASGGTAEFLAPAHHQRIARLRWERGNPVLLGLDSIHRGGRWTTGLPSPFFPGSERAVAKVRDGRERVLGTDSVGFDFEGLAVDGRGGFWASDEYGPRLVHLARDSAGYGIDRVLAPGAGLPAVFARRALNRGLEALCRTPGGRLVAAFQGSLDNTTGAKLPKNPPTVAHRLLVLDPATGALQEFLEEVPTGGGGKASRRTKTGACAAIDEHRVVLLQHRKLGKGKVGYDLVLVDFSKASDVHLAGDPSARGRLVEGRTLEEVVALGRLGAAGIQPATRRILVSEELDGEGLLSKPEGLVIGPGTGYVIVFDNDFGVEGGRRATTFLHGVMPIWPPPGR